MSLILTAPEYQFLDDNGDPVSLGKVYTYINTTETDKATYTDSSEDTANANPIILDAGGRAPIWVLTDGLYTFKVTTAADVLVDTLNSVSGNTATFNTLLTQATNLDMNGASIVTNNNQDLSITPHGTGTVNVSDIQLQTDMDTNGFDIEIDDTNGVKNSSGLKDILNMGVTASAVNYLKITNAATGNDPVISALGTDTNIGITINVKGVSNVPNGTGNRSGSVLCGSGAVIADDDDLATVAYVTSVVGTMDYTLDEPVASLFLPTFASDAEVLAATSTTKLVKEVDVRHAPATFYNHGNVTYSGSTPTINLTGYTGHSLTDLGVGLWRINTVTITDNAGVASWSGDCGFVANGKPASPPSADDTIVNVTGIVGGASGTISGSCTDGSTTNLADHSFYFMIAGGQRV